MTAFLQITFFRYRSHVQLKCLEALNILTNAELKRYSMLFSKIQMPELNHKRVIAAVISIWLLSAIISSIVIWNPLFIISRVAGFVNMTVCLILVVIVYWRIYIVLKRHKNHIQSLQIQEAQQGVQNGDLLNFLKLRKSALGKFYVFIVFLICYLPSFLVI